MMGEPRHHRRHPRPKSRASRERIECHLVYLTHVQRLLRRAPFPRKPRHEPPREGHLFHASSERASRFPMFGDGTIEAGQVSSRVGVRDRDHSTRSAAATARSTSRAVVRQLDTETRMHRIPRHVVPVKNASPVALMAAMTASVLRS